MPGMADLAQHMPRKMGQYLGRKLVLTVKELANIVILTMMARPSSSDILQAKMDSESSKEIMFQREQMD